jgi:hypothetical protein
MQWLQAARCVQQDQWRVMPPEPLLECLSVAALPQCPQQACLQAMVERAQAAISVACVTASPQQQPSLLVHPPQLPLLPASQPAAPCLHACATCSLPAAEQRHLPSKQALPRWHLPRNMVGTLRRLAGKKPHSRPVVPKTPTRSRCHGQQAAAAAAASSRHHSWTPCRQDLRGVCLAWFGMCRSELCVRPGLQLM